MFSGVYYLVVPRGSGTLRLYKPFVAASDFLAKTQLNDFTYTRANYQPLEGLLLVFTSDLEHLGLQNESAEVGDRIAIAFDICAISTIEAPSGIPTREYLLPLN